MELGMNKLEKTIEYAKDISVLYVEDDEDARGELTQILNIFFKNLFIAENGQIGLELFNANSIDLVISDVTMPVMDGLEMMHILREQNKDFKAIFVTAHSGKNILLDSIKLNIDGYILKPIEQEQLISLLSKIIDVIHSQKLKVNFDKKLQIELQKQKELIQEQSKTLIEMLQKDAKTNLYNFEKLKIDYNDFVRKPTLMLINIDNFNFINLTHGYSTGDMVIKQVALFLNTLTKDTITVYKLYGDEFMMVFEDLEIMEVLDFAEHIQYKINQQIHFVGTEEYNISVSIGLLECTKDDIVLPYNKVKLALQDGRSNRKNSITIYKEDMSLLEKQQELLKWAKKTKDAMEHKNLKAFYQPMYEFKEQKITKYETLVRIVDDGEIISPFYFLPSAKINGLLPRLTKIVITQAFEYFKNYKDLSFSVNITDEDLKDGELFGLLLYLCDKYEIQPSTVTLEILENINDYDVGDANKKLEELRKAGFLIALDDFGSESSNFTRLQQLNVDIIKIDALFVKDLDTNINSRHIVETMIYLAKKTNKKTIAEFVHSKEIFDIVQELGVDYAQGYYVGQPLAEVI